MDIDPKTYPTRMFIRLVAHQQLLADATGQPISVMMQRSGREPYVQSLSPDADFPGQTSNSQDFVDGLSFSMGASVNPTEAGAKDPKSFEDALSMPAQGQAIDPKQGQNTSSSEIDEALFADLVKNAFYPSRNPELYQSCGTAKAAAAVETRVIAEIVAAYRQIKSKQGCPVVQGLNKLL